MKNSIRVLSYNIHKGFSAGGRRFVLPHIKEAIHLIKPDLVFLQEVHGEHRHHEKKISLWPKSSQPEYIAENIWPYMAYGKNASYKLGNHGNAVLSKFKIVEMENLDVSAHRFENRGLLHVRMQVPWLKTDLHCLCVHLGLTNQAREYQTKRIVERVDKDVPMDSPLIIAGDFNDWSDRGAKTLVSKINIKEIFHHKYGQHARTYPSIAPFLKLDRIYCRGFDIISAEVLAGAPWRSLSDHSAIFGELIFGHQ